MRWVRVNSRTYRTYRTYRLSPRYQYPTIRADVIATSPAHLHPASAVTRTERLVAGIQRSINRISLLLGRCGHLEPLALRAAQALQPDLACPVFGGTDSHNLRHAAATDRAHRSFAAHVAGEHVSADLIERHGIA